MSNNERQRRFCERNPGYYTRRRRRKQAKFEALRAANALAAAEVAVTVTRREPLMLPAPVETIEIPGVNAIPTILQTPTPEKVPVSRHIAVPSAFASFFAD